MDIWLSILDFWHTHRREIIRYGLALLFFASAVFTGRTFFMILIPILTFLMFAAERWGEPWRQRGEQFTKRKPQ